VVSRAANSELWWSAKNPMFWLQQPREHPALVLRHDAVADAQENDGTIVGSPDHEQQECHHRIWTTPGKLDVGPLDDVTIR
jgi:hypothetical protein